MSCNSILDVSRVYFCGGPITTGRNWIGTGSSFDISCVETLKMTVPDTSAVEIVVGVSSEMLIDSSHVHLRAGSLDTPSIHFGLAFGDADTGFYRIGNNSIGVAGDGELIASFWDTVTSVGYSKGLNVGAYTSGTAPINICGIKRLSATHTNSWEDGNCGNSAALNFTPSDFTVSDVAGGPGAGRGFGVASARFFPSQFNFTTGMAAGIQGAEVVAVKLLPKGFTTNSLPVTVTNALLGGGNPPWAGAFGNFASIQIFYQEQVSGVAPPISLGGPTNMTAWNVNSQNFQYTPAVSVVGTGDIAIVVRIFMAGGTIMTSADGLVGVSIPIIRA